MQLLEVSGAVRPLYGSLGVKGLILIKARYQLQPIDKELNSEHTPLGKSR
jgi:hypothetical protein